jgi:hypothetical protein
MIAGKRGQSPRGNRRLGTRLLIESASANLQDVLHGVLDAVERMRRVGGAFFRIVAALRRLQVGGEGVDPLLIHLSDCSSRVRNSASASATRRAICRLEHAFGKRISSCI